MTPISGGASATRLARRSTSSTTSSGVSNLDTRTPFQRDRDRVLYSEHFRRLSGVTQVASAAEGVLIHNRLTHSIKVAQVARRLAERLLFLHQADGLGSFLDADVVEAAALAHDLGHPPFGHVADHALCRLAEDAGLSDGFEGNAQTFRIVTRLAVRGQSPEYGLDLTRATLAAVAKYPWERAPDSVKGDPHREKFSFYSDDKDAAEFALRGCQAEEKSLECQVMDLADAITYSVHDLEDFYRAGYIPLSKLISNEDYRSGFLRQWKAKKPAKAAQIFAQDSTAWTKDIKPMLRLLDAEDAEPGSRSEAMLLDSFRSMAITKFVNSISVVGDAIAGFNLRVDPLCGNLMGVFQRLIWHYVIDTPRLATQQAGQVRIIEELYKFFEGSLLQSKDERLPIRFRELAEGLPSRKPKTPPLARLAIDITASLTEAEALIFYRKITGFDGGSVFDRLA